MEQALAMQDEKDRNKMQLLGKHPMAKAPEEANSPQNPSLFNSIGIREEVGKGSKTKPFI